MGFAPLLDPQVDGAIVALGALCGFTAALGIVYVLQSFNRAIIGGLAKLLGEIPYAGDVLASPVNDVYKWMDHEFGAAITYLDAQIARWYRSLTQIVVWTAQEIERHANLIATLAEALAGTATLDAIGGLQKELSKAAASAIGYAEGEAERVFGKARAGIDALISDLTKRLEQAEHATAQALSHTLKWGEARVHGLEDDLDWAKKRIEALEKRWAKKALTAAVAAVLADLGLGWLHCSSVKKVGKSICNSPLSAIEGLLGLLGDALTFSAICDVLPYLEDGVKLLDPVITEFTSGVTAVLCRGKYKPTDPVALPALQLPTESATLPTLHLP